MKINNNIQALNSYRNLYQNQFQTSKNLEKLSSGLRINRAADDAAGLAISEKMRSQIRGLKMAERNAMDGISLMQTSEGAMQEVHTMLQRMRELAVQAANDTNTEYDREQIQKEIDQLKSEIDSISEKTEFNTRKLLNGFSAVLTTTTSENEINLSGTPHVTNANIKSGNYTIEVGEPTFTQAITQPAAGVNDDTDIKFYQTGDDAAADMKFGEYTILVRDVENIGDGGFARIEVLDPDGLSIGTKSIQIGADAEEYNPDDFSDLDSNNIIAGIAINASKIDRAGTIKTKLEATAEFTLVDNATSDPIFSPKTLDSRNGLFKYDGVEYQFSSKMNQGELDFTITNNALSFQIGPNTNQNVMIDIPRMDIVTLGIEGIDVLSNEGASQAIFQLDQAINKLSDARAKLGAVQNRMEHTINNLQVTHENLTASESRIRDADMALEMTEFTRNNILNQSATAMLAQANQLPQGVLQLLQ